MNDYEVVDMNKVIDFLNDKKIPPVCTLCKEQKLHIMKNALSVPVTNKTNNITMSSKSAVYITLICENCGNTIFINAITTDLLLSSDNEMKEVNNNG